LAYLKPAVIRLANPSGHFHFFRVADGDEPGAGVDVVPLGHFHGYYHTVHFSCEGGSFNLLLGQFHTDAGLLHLSF
jgi:hypothetical protein